MGVPRMLHHIPHGRPADTRKVADASLVSFCASTFWLEPYQFGGRCVVRVARFNCFKLTVIAVNKKISIFALKLGNYT